MELLKQIFTWWNSQTLGTRIYTWRHGNLVGKDSFGNSFYECGNKKRRWVIFKDDIDASKISAEWHGWLHHTFSQVPRKDTVKRNKWEKPHLANLTGSDKAYHPQGSQKNDTKAWLDYEPWLPKSE